jgi:hypothetical protein
MSYRSEQGYCHRRSEVTRACDVGQQEVGQGFCRKPTGTDQGLTCCLLVVSRVCASDLPEVSRDCVTDRPEVSRDCV